MKLSDFLISSEVKSLIMSVEASSRTLSRHLRETTLSVAVLLWLCLFSINVMD